VVLTSSASADVAARAADAGVLGVLVKPVRPDDLGPALDVARARFRELAVLREESRRLQGQLEARKVIDRAKGLLMLRLGLSEPEAFRRIQKTAMDTRRTMADVARALLARPETPAVRPTR
jgi:response regulator NasT